MNKLFMLVFGTVVGNILGMFYLDDDITRSQDP